MLNNFLKNHQYISPKVKFGLIIFIILLILGLGSTIALSVIKNNNDQKAERVMLSQLYGNYKSTYWDSSSGRTIDRQSDNITTSEGQSYTMLRAVWENDQTTFNKTWQWTQNNLKRSDDLFSWKWGENPDGSYGVMTSIGGNNTASDADSDIALSLVMASKQWNNSTYMSEAKQIISEIWMQDTVVVKGVRYVSADNLEKNSQTNVVINLSYLSPYSYRIFSTIDSSDNWMGIVNSSYSVINTSIDDALDVQSSAGLPPDWIFMNNKTGVISAPTTGSGLDTNYGYDAMRTPWRIALDYEWYGDAIAKTTLEKMSFLQNQWTSSRAIDSIYSHGGTVVSTDQPPEAYGTAISYFVVADPSLAKQVYQQKLLPLYSASKKGWSQNMNYYSDNWAWFGMALYLNQLPNLSTK